MNQEIESRSIYGKSIPEETQRESQFEESALIVALSRIAKEAKRKLRAPKIKSRGRHT